jgi:hypothetical protein
MRHLPLAKNGRRASLSTPEVNADGVPHLVELIEPATGLEQRHASGFVCEPGAPRRLFFPGSFLQPLGTNPLLREFFEVLIKLKRGSRRAAHDLHGITTPRGMDDAQIRSLKRERQSRKELQDVATRSFHCGAVREFAPGLLLGVRGIQEPAVSGLVGSTQDVEFVVAEDAEGILPVHEVADAFDDGRAIGAAIAEVADEDQFAVLGVIAVAVVAEAIHQGSEGVDLSVDVADDVDWTCRQCGYEHLIPIVPPFRYIRGKAFTSDR